MVLSEVQLHTGVELIHSLTVMGGLFSFFMWEKDCSHEYDYVDLLWIQTLSKQVQRHFAKYEM